MPIKTPIYLDYNATTPLLPNVREAMLDIMDIPLNPSSVHGFGRHAKSIMEVARSRIAHLAGCDDRYQVIFTANGTEANNIALNGFKDHKLITTNVEHASVLHIVGEGVIPVDSNGIVQLEVLEKILAQMVVPVLVSVQFANNETGVIQPLKEIIDIVHKAGGLIHTDASQAFGKVEFSAKDLDVDLITISAHKFGGPVGAGALLFKKHLPLKPFMKGGGQEYRLRPGTQNIVAIHGFGVAAEIALNMVQKASEIECLRNYLEDKLTSINNEVVVFGKSSLRLPNTSLISMPNVHNETQVIYFDLNGIAVSAGAACSSGKVDVSLTLLAMGYSEEVAKTALRISLGYGTTKAEIDAFIKLWCAFTEKQFLQDAA
jgi:cysteine desulfurase